MTNATRRITPKLTIVCIVAMAMSVCSACGSQAVATTGHAVRPTIIGRGRTAAGTTFVATAQPIEGCQTNIDIREGGKIGQLSLCYSQFQSPPEAAAICLLGSIVIHMRVSEATHNVRLTMSDGKTVTSPVMVVPQRLGGPATLYYQVVRGAASIPTALTELDRRNQPLSTVRVPGVIGCSKQSVKHLPDSEGMLAKEIGPGGTEFTITTKDEPSRTEFGSLRMTSTQSGSTTTIGFGALRLALPLEWEIAHICKPYPYAVVYGLLPARDRVFVGSGHKYNALSRVAIPSSVRPRTVLVFGIVRGAPSNLIVRADAGRTLVTQNIGDIFAHLVCE
jgi:hypothetical protein